MGRHGGAHPPCHRALGQRQLCRHRPAQQRQFGHKFGQHRLKAGGGGGKGAGAVLRPRTIGTKDQVDRAVLQMQPQPAVQKRRRGARASHFEARLHFAPVFVSGQR